jgi:DNA-binding CsgD family transcriptional regulator
LRLPAGSHAALASLVSADTILSVLRPDRRGLLPDVSDPSPPDNGDATPVSVAQPQRVGELSAKQRECLRLLHGRSQKEVALVLGRAPVTVEKHLEAARAILGATTSRRAAAWYHWYLVQEGGQGGRPGEGESIYGPQAVAGPPEIAPFQPSSSVEDEWPEPVIEPAVVEEAQASFSLAGPTSAPPPPIWPLQTGESRNGLGLGLRLAWIATILVGLLLGTAMLIGGLANLTPVVEAFQH